MRSQAPVVGLILVNAFLVLKHTLRGGAKVAPQQKIIYCFYVVSQRISPKGHLSPSAPSKNPTKSRKVQKALRDLAFWGMARPTRYRKKRGEPTRMRGLAAV